MPDSSPEVHECSVNFPEHVPAPCGERRCLSAGAGRAPAQGGVTPAQQSQSMPLLFGHNFFFFFYCNVGGGEGWHKPLVFVPGKDVYNFVCILEI